MFITALALGKTFAGNPKSRGQKRFAFCQTKARGLKLQFQLKEAKSLPLFALNKGMTWILLLFVLHL